MVIILKIICFGLWLLIMITLIKGSRRKTISNFHEVKLQLDDKEDIEMSIRLTLRRLKTRDRLVIENLTARQSNQTIINWMLQKNPSILCMASGEYCV